MFNDKFKFDSAADLAKSILEADTKTKMEALKGNQSKLDKNHNGKLDAQDFKLLRGEKKVNEAEADYQSSYRVGKTANFKPKASDVGQGRKITGKMGKYGKQPDDDNMVEPPPEHKVGDVKTDPSAIVPGHSTMGAKLHLASLPRDSEGNPVVKGARRVSAADLVAKRKAMMAGQKNEEVESITEGKMDKMTLSGLWHKHARHSFAADQGYGHGDNSMTHNQHAATAIENHVRKHHGNKVADDMVSHSDHYVARTEYAGPNEAPHHEKEAEKLRKKNKISGDLYGESVDYVQQGVAEETEIEEGQSHQAKTTMKHIDNPTPGEKKAAKDIKPGISGYRDRIAMLKSAQARGDLKKEEVEQIDERELTAGETSEKERIVHGMKKSLKGFKARYGDRAKEVMYATATKQAKKD